MEIIVRKVGEFIGEKAKETFGAKKDLIKLILAVIGCIVAAAAIAVIVINIVNRRRKATIEVLESADTDGDGEIDTYLVDTTGDGNADTVYLDTDGNGAVDTIIEDTDGDGEPDTAYGM
ncbi:MAG: hypothetical protein II680_01850 [Clostridia bacterium]|nr:hypothetical protein [Clostridia bacterium]